MYLKLFLRSWGAVAAADQRRCTPTRRGSLSSSCGALRCHVCSNSNLGAPRPPIQMWTPPDLSTTRHHVIDRYRRAVEPKQEIPTVRTGPVTRGALDPPSFFFGFLDKQTRWFQEREAKGPMRIRTDRHIGAVGADLGIVWNLKWISLLQKSRWLTVSPF